MYVYIIVVVVNIIFVAAARIHSEYFLGNRERMENLHSCQISVIPRGLWTLVSEPLFCAHRSQISCFQI